MMNIVNHFLLLLAMIGVLQWRDGRRTSYRPPRRRRRRTATTAAVRHARVGPP